MERKGSSLAARFRRALDGEAERSRLAEQERLREAEAARRARAALLDDLEAFGRQIGHLAVVRDEAGLTLRRGERSVRFEPADDGDRLRVLVDGSDEHGGRVYREARLEHRWVWSFLRRGREERLPLFDAGLEELMVMGLGLPRPGSDESATSAAASALTPGPEAGGPRR
jgi:hypothetical protein